MKLVIVPGFLGFADEPHHIDLLERAKLKGIKGFVVESEELANSDFATYRTCEFLLI